MLKLLLLLIFCRPFISSLAYPGADFFYSIFMLGFLLIWITLKKIDMAAIRQLWLPLALFMLSLIISVILSYRKSVSLVELYEYLNGILIFVVAASPGQRDKSKIISCILSAAFIISILAIYQYFFGFKHLLSYMSKHNITNAFALDYISQRRIFFPFVTPNILGGYLAMTIPLFLAYAKRSWILLIPVSLALLLTRSLGGLVSVFLGLALYFYLLGKLDRKKIIFFAALSLVVVFVASTRMSAQKDYLQPAFSATMRLDYWKGAWEIIKAHPLIGVGLGNFNLPEARFAHNSYLQLWVEAGLFGLLSFLWLVGIVFKYGFNKRLRAAGLISATSIFLLHNLIDFSFFLPEVSLIWWILLGTITYVEKDNSGR